MCDLSFSYVLTAPDDADVYTDVTKYNNYVISLIQHYLHSYYMLAIIDYLNSEFKRVKKADRKVPKVVIPDLAKQLIVEHKTGSLQDKELLETYAEFNNHFYKQFEKTYLLVLFKRAWGTKVDYDIPFWVYEADPKRYKRTICNKFFQVLEKKADLQELIDFPVPAFFHEKIIKNIRSYLKMLVILVDIFDHDEAQHRLDYVNTCIAQLKPFKKKRKKKNVKKDEHST